MLREEFLSKLFHFIYRENDEEVGIGEVDDRVRIVNIRIKKTNICTIIL